MKKLFLTIFFLQAVMYAQTPERTISQKTKFNDWINVGGVIYADDTIYVRNNKGILFSNGTYLTGNSANSFERAYIDSLYAHFSDYILIKDSVRFSKPLRMPDGTILYTANGMGGNTFARIKTDTASALNDNFILFTDSVRFLKQIYSILPQMTFNDTVIGFGYGNRFYKFSASTITASLRDSLRNKISIHGDTASWLRLTKPLLQNFVRIGGENNLNVADTFIYFFNRADAGWVGDYQGVRMGADGNEGFKMQGWFADGIYKNIYRTNMDSLIFTSKVKSEVPIILQDNSTINSVGALIFAGDTIYDATLASANTWNFANAKNLGGKTIAIGKDAASYNGNLMEESIIIGQNAANNLLSDGFNSVIIGNEAGKRGITNGVIIGFNAGNISEANNAGAIIIGYNAGQNHTNLENKLIIHNSNTLTPLLDGTFTADTASALLQINGKLRVGSNTFSERFGVAGAARITGTTTTPHIVTNYISNYNDTVFAYSSTTHSLKIGHDAGFFNPTGAGNLLIGQKSGYRIVAGYDNIAIGRESGQAIGNGYRNVIIGDKAGYSITGGAANVLIGAEAGYNFSTANFNISIGFRAGQNATGNSNVYIGRQAGNFNTGNSNLFVGAYAGYYLMNEGSRMIFNTLDRGSRAKDTTDSPIYIEQNNTTTLQRMKLNAQVVVKHDFSHDLRHAHAYFSDSTRVIAVTQNVYSHITNANKNLFTVDENNQLTIAGDTITILTPGDYVLYFNTTITGGNGDDFKFRVYKNNALYAIGGPHTSTNTGNYSSTGWTWYLKGCVAGDDFKIMVTNTQDGDDPTINDASIYIRKEHN